MKLIKLFFKRIALFIIWLILCLFRNKHCGHSHGSGSGSCGGSGSGSGSGKFTGIKLVRKPEYAIGKGFHRTGWHWVLKQLNVINCNDGILFDDFFEQNFCYNDSPVVYKEPWVTIIHHPSRLPFFANHRENLDVIFETEAFKESLPNLKMVFTLTEDLAVYLRTILPCPVVALKHPAPFVKQKWSIEKFKNNPIKRIIQVGLYLRNTQLIHQIPSIETVLRNRLWSSILWLQQYDIRIQKYWEVDKKRDVFKLKAFEGDLGFIPANQYDNMLDKNVVVSEYFSLAASNTILDCIVRNTPIFINPLPAAIEYLGEDYPLYFTDPKEIPLLLDKVEEAHNYLSNMDKSFLSIEVFISSIFNNIRKI
ncbi:MAG: hypothetical protein ACSLE0_23415 [Chitinophagaceae bacterium]